MNQYSPLEMDVSSKDGRHDVIRGESSSSEGRGDGRNLQRSLSFYDSFCILVGIIIGSGIFSSPGIALSRAGSPGLALLSWASSGILVMITAQCYFELAGMFPSCGGDYDFLRHAYGPRTAFSFAWFNFWISKPGSQAIIATIFGRYTEKVFISLHALTGSSLPLPTPLSQTTTSQLQGESSFTTIAAILLIVILTLMNCYGLKESSLLQNFLTTSKLLLVSLLFLMAISYAVSHPSVAKQNLGSKSFLHSDISGFGSAQIACLWSFDGWADLLFMVEEMKNPNILPLVVCVSVAAVTGVYLLANIAYLSVMSVDQLTKSTAVAVDLASSISSSSSFALTILTLAFAVGVSISTASSCNGSIMTGGRAFYAVARNNDAPHCLASLNSKGSPWCSLLAQGAWAVVLLLVPNSSFSTLLDFFGPCSWFFYALACSSVIVLRIKMPHLHRPYRVRLFPLPPILVILIAIQIIFSSFLKEPLFTSIAFLFCALALPFQVVKEKFAQSSHLPGLVDAVEAT